MSIISRINPVRGPIKCNEDDKAGYWALHDGESVIGLIYDKGHALEIVRMINSHKQLEAACRSLVILWESLPKESAVPPTMFMIVRDALNALKTAEISNKPPD